VPAVALVVAAGRGERLGADGPKAFVVLAGRPMLEWSLDALRAASVAQVVVALPEGFEAPEGCVGVRGGAERSHSVRNALAAADPSCDRVLVHDAARPLRSPQTVRDVVAALDHSEAAIAACRVVDTVKEGEAHVERTLDRSRLWAVQTPQGFRREVLAAALDQPDEVLAAATDDASLVEARGGRVALVPSPRTNFKVTTPEDLRLAESLLSC
jgi:2-C-methyl-D-erythritol 4-phosphate cytidylyltransferase